MHHIHSGIKNLTVVPVEVNIVLVLTIVDSLRGRNWLCIFGLNRGTGPWIASSLGDLFSCTRRSEHDALKHGAAVRFRELRRTSLLRACSLVRGETLVFWGLTL